MNSDFSIEQTDSLVFGVVVDVCTRSFVLLSDKGEEKEVQCDSFQQFTNILEFVRDSLEPTQVLYAEPAVSLR